MTEYSLQSILLAIVPKLPAVLSFLGSSYIIRSVLKDPRKRRKPYHRIMLGMSCSDVFASTVYFLGTWLIPRGSMGQYGPVFMASGTDETCNLSGFFTQFAVCSPLYNGTLALYYLLSIKCGWKDERIKKVEPLLHAFPILFSLATAITALSLNLYGSVGWLCWINPPDKSNPPQSKFVTYQWAFLFAPLWICILFVTVIMFILWWTMKSLEKNLSRYAGSQLSRQRKLSKEIAFQGILYVVAFYITWFFPTLQRIIELVQSKNYFVLQFFDTTLLPLQGLLNVYIYLRPRFQQYRKSHPDLNWWSVMWNARDTNRPSVARLHDSGGPRSTRYEPGRTSFTNVDESARFQARHQQSFTAGNVAIEDNGQDLDVEEQRMQHVGVSTSIYNADLDNESSESVSKRELECA